MRKGNPWVWLKEENPALTNRCRVGVKPLVPFIVVRSIVNKCSGKEAFLCPRPKGCNGKLFLLTFSCVFLLAQCLVASVKVTVFFIFAIRVLVVLLKVTRPKLILPNALAAAVTVFVMVVKRQLLLFLFPISLLLTLFLPGPLPVLSRWKCLIIITVFLALAIITAAMRGLTLII
ncbi:hypothetical protein GGTG_05272 [Gaeumannomyces tritici R3-111a-1]|uniref:Uncharacterized protein n=1 Tax=Gaeumannomyces tritici (strain R3-111a-1) TaxID=644352 RepID=J3NVF7_GAET3|nr:hypothetical protein GGTG_05272 [Gaeumannomyces tritici R3-111a-1]EJT75335.1 hypothetical protein GGTG_05272 [Gaeumannomyces tritici R3-111a-1]